MTPDHLTSPALQTPATASSLASGGVSTGPWASLNCSPLRARTTRPHVAENRRPSRCQALGATHPARPVTQVHGADVVTVTAALGPPAKAPAPTPWSPTSPGLALGIITADCTPVLLHDAAAGVVGAVHAGWRGALAGVLEATVAAMRALGATPAGIAAAIGPSIRQPSYEVGPDLRDAVLARDATHARFFADGKPGHWQFDLAGYCAARLDGLATVDTLDGPTADTFANVDGFFSHRRRTLAGGGPIGHQISAIVL